MKPYTLPEKVFWSIVTLILFFAVVAIVAAFQPGGILFLVVAGALIFAAILMIELRRIATAPLFPPDKGKFRIRGKLVTWLYLFAAAALCLSIGIYSKAAYGGTGILYDSATAVACIGMFAFVAHVSWNTPPLTAWSTVVIALAQGLANAMCMPFAHFWTAKSGDYMGFVPPVADKLVFLAFLAASVGSVTIPMIYRKYWLDSEKPFLIILASIGTTGMWWAGLQILMASDRNLSFGID